MSNPFKTMFSADRDGQPDDPDGAISAEEAAAIRQQLAEVFLEKPPTIGVIGVSGTGKSSVINAMFKTTLEISHTRACTKEFRAVDMKMRLLRGPAESEPVSLVVVDAPGLGEDVRQDPGYIAEYLKRLPDCDVILWLLAARNRAVSLDQHYLGQLGKFHDRIVFGLSQVDLAHPMDWNDRINDLSPEMEANVADIVRDRSEKIAQVIGHEPDLIPFSATKGYHLEMLFNQLIGAAPEDRAFIFGLLKNFSYRDFIPPTAQPFIRRQD